ncbi:MAG: 2-keto-4-pentenoate hydratase [Acidimicrobiales bacterium]
MDSAGAARELLAMRADHRIEPDLPKSLRPATLAEAYGIQAQVVAGLELADAIGYKCACTSPIAQEALAIDRPLFGRLLAGTTSPGGSTLDADRFVHRVIEAEVGFRLGEDVEPVDGGHTAETIAQCIEVAIPAIEVVDYRYESWTVGALQVAADNAIHGWWVAGEPVAGWQHLDLASMAVTVKRNGAAETTGSGANVLGHPLNVMAWLADELPGFGMQLKAGDFVTTGVTTGVFEADAGDEIIAQFAGLGSVSVSFT